MNVDLGFLEEEEDWTLPGGEMGDGDNSNSLREVGPTSQLEHGAHTTVQVPTQTVQVKNI